MKKTFLVIMFVFMLASFGISEASNCSYAVPGDGSTLISCPYGYISSLPLYSAWIIIYKNNDYLATVYNSTGDAVMYFRNFSGIGIGSAGQVSYDGLNWY